MPRAKTTADLITEVRAGVASTTADPLVSDTELLSLADSELRTEIAQILIAARSEYWLREYTVALTASTSTYALPDRALGMALRDVTIYDSSGSEWPLYQVDATERYRWATTATGQPGAFSLEDGEIVLLPAPTSALTLRLRYYGSPSTLDLTSNCARIDKATNTETLVMQDSAVASLVPGTDYVYADVIRGTGMCDRQYEDRIIKAYVTTTITLDATTPIVVADIADASLISGGRMDWLARAGYTPLPPVPDVLWPVLVAAGRRAYAEAVGDRPAMSAAQAMFDRKAATARSMLTPRVDGKPKRIVPSGTPLRGGGARGLPRGLR